MECCRFGKEGLGSFPRSCFQDFWDVPSGSALQLFLGWNRSRARPSIPRNPSAPGMRWNSQLEKFQLMLRNPWKNRTHPWLSAGSTWISSGYRKAAAEFPPNSSLSQFIPASSKGEGHPKIFLEASSKHSWSSVQSLVLPRTSQRSHHIPKAVIPTSLGRDQVPSSWGIPALFPIPDIPLEPAGILGIFIPPLFPIPGWDGIGIIGTSRDLGIFVGNKAHSHGTGSSRIPSSSNFPNPPNIGTDIPKSQNSRAGFPRSPQSQTQQDKIPRDEFPRNSRGASR